MSRRVRRRPSTLRLFATYAVVSLAAVLALGVVLALALTHHARQRGLVEGRSEALLVAQAAIEPQLTGEPLSRHLNHTEWRRVKRIVMRAVGERHVLRLRLRDLHGRVVFSDDGSGFTEKPEEEALDAASGHVVARLTRLNQDSNDTGRAGVPAVEVYLPLMGGVPSHRVGVLEMYLPYAPISKDVNAGLHSLYLDLGVGLGILYLVLFAITASVSRALRREAAVNAFLAEHDTLTELPNRTLFRRRAQTAVAASRSGRAATIAIVDLDRFKEVNDSLGHHNGDLLLTELGRRLAAALPSDATLARLGGDEFGLVVRGVTDAESMLWRLRGIIEREVEISGLALSVEASVGYVLAPDDGTDVDRLLQHADVAMYAAKANHAGVMRYAPDQDRFDASRLSLVSELRTAIDADALVLHYQPQTRLADQHVSAVEALVRWQHPVHGLVYPDDFLPLAEQTDVIDKLTAAVIQTAATQLLALGPEQAGLRVAVNVSARSLIRRSFSRDVLKILERVGLPAERLIIEVTETALVADPLGAAAMLRELADAGVSISLDDFGRGQTSLAYLSALPLDELKIDRSFVSNMVEDPAQRAIVRSIINLGHNLSLNVVAEGVETNEILAALEDQQCDVGQGFLLGRPMPYSQLQTWLSGSAYKVRQ